MSEMEYHTGTALEIFPEGDSFLEKIEWLKSRNYEIEEYGEDSNYIISKTVCYLFDGRFFKIDDIENDGNTIEAISINNVFKYTLNWYNGGGGFDEVLESAIKNEEKRLKDKNET